MNETHGAIQHVELAPQLWCIAFFPFAAAIAILYFGVTLGGASEKEKRDTTRLLSQIAVAGPLASLAVALFYVFELSKLAPPSRFFLLHLGNWLRIGQLDANVDFALDPLAATFVVAISAVGAAVAFVLAARPRDDSWRLLLRIDALVAAALFFVLADNLPLALVGWGATGALASSLGNSNASQDARARRFSFAVARVGDAAVLIAAASLFWTFGGTFSEGDYVPDLDARYAAVSSMPTSPTSSTAPISRVSPNAKASVTLANTPGALLFADDARTPLENAGNPARAPFARQPVDAGIHTFRVHPGSGLDDSIVAHVRFVEGAEVSLVLVGATMTFREMRDQLLLADDRGTLWRKENLIARRAFGSVGALTFACLLLLIAAAARGAALPFEAWLAGTCDAAPFPTAALVQAIAGCTAIYLLARVSFFFELSPAASTMAAVVGVATALLAALAASTASSLPRFVGHVAAAEFGFALLAFGAGSSIDAVIVVTVASLAIAGLGIASSRAPSRRSETAARLATTCLAAAPIPGVGISFGVLRAFGVTLVSDRLVHVPGPLLAVVGAFAMGTLSFALWRWLYIAYKKDEKGREKDAKKLSPAVTSSAERSTRLALGALALFLGVASDLPGAHPFTTDASWFSGWLAPSLGVSTAHESGVVDAIVFALGFGAALAGFAQARSRSRSRGALEGSGGGIGAWEASRAAGGPTIARVSIALASRASLLARDTDRFVIDGVIGAGAGVVRLASKIFSAGDKL